MQKPPNYNSDSRGHKTKGNSYEDRYTKNVGDSKKCPECGNESLYRDEWKTRISFKCLKRDCRHHWFEQKFSNAPRRPRPSTADKVAQIIAESVEVTTD